MKSNIGSKVSMNSSCKNAQKLYVIIIVRKTRFQKKSIIDSLICIISLFSIWKEIDETTYKSINLRFFSHITAQLESILQSSSIFVFEYEYY